MCTYIIVKPRHPIPQAHSKNKCNVHFSRGFEKVIRKFTQANLSKVHAHIRTDHIVSSLRVN